MENTFWQANFWGIIGTVTGAVGLIISWLNWKYSHPKIKITQATLSMREFDNKFLLGDLQKLIKNYENGSFYICYSTNTGIKHKVKLDMDFF